MKNIFIPLLVTLFITSCVVIRPGEVGIKQKIGKLSPDIYVEQSVVYNPFITKVVKTSLQTNDLELSLSLPSKEGLSITSQISILYRLDKEKVADVIRTLGLGYEVIITNVFRSSAADVCARYYAKDMHSGMRSEIEQKIKERMGEILTEQGIIVESVLMKSIQLPAGLARSIEQKLQAEQDALRMEFVLKQEKLEADRKIINATGERDAQLILSEGLTDKIIQIKSIEAYKELSQSSNAKIIITDGKSPVFLSSGE